MCDIETLRLFVNERLAAVADDILAVFVRTIVQYQQQIDLQHRQLELLTPQGTSDLTDKSSQQQERRSDLLQEELQPPQIKEELQELIRRQEEGDGLTLTITAVKSNYNEVHEAELLASTSGEHLLKTQADVENCGASQQAADHVQPISSYCSESDDTDDSDGWEETREDRPLKTHKTHAAEGQRSSSRKKPSREPISAPQAPSMRAQGTRETTFSCAICGKAFNRKGNLKRHTRTHTDIILVCEEEKSPEQQQRRSVLLKEEPQPAQIKGKRQELIHKPGAAERSMFTLLPVSSESDTAGSDEFEEPREDRQLKTRKTRAVEGRRFSLRNKLSQELTSLRQSPPARDSTQESTFSCTVCGKTFNRKGNLKRHRRTHTDFHLVLKDEQSPQEPESPQTNEEQQEEDDGSPLTLGVGADITVFTATGRDNRKTDFESSQSRCSESDAEDSDENKETRGHRSLKTLSKRRGKGQRSLIKKLSSHESGPSILPGLRSTPSSSAHTTERIFICTVCGKKFNRNGNLRRHARTHCKVEDLQLCTFVHI